MKNISVLKLKSLIGPAVIVGGLLFASVALASIVVGLSTTNVSNDVAYTALTLNKPSDVIQGDVLLANVSVNGGSPAGITAPTGWTLIARTDNDTNISIASYWKTVGASEPTSYTWTISPQTRAVGGITRYSGADPTNPIDAVASSTGRGTVATAPAVTTMHTNDQVVALFAIDAGKNNTPFFSTTTGMTKRYDAKNTPFGPTTAAEDKTQASAGSSGAADSTVSSGAQRDWVAQQIALRMQSLSNDLIAYWKMDGNSNDATGHGNNGSDTAITYSSGNGVINQGAGFTNASSSEIAITDDSTLKPTGNFSVNAWVKIASGQNVPILQSYTTSNDAGFRADAQGNAQFVVGDNAGHVYQLDGTATIDDNNWHMLTFVYDGSHIYIYVDGNSTPDASVGWPYGLGYQNPNYVRIGDYNWGGGDFGFGQGAADEIGFWSRALNTSEISQLYNAGVGIQYPF